MFDELMKEEQPENKSIYWDTVSESLLQCQFSCLFQGYENIFIKKGNNHIDQKLLNF